MGNIMTGVYTTCPVFLVMLFSKNYKKAYARGLPSQSHPHSAYRFSCPAMSACRQNCCRWWAVALITFRTPLGAAGASQNPYTK